MVITDSLIGQWVQRTDGAYAPVPITRWHRIESVIEGDAVTTCGRRMRDTGLKRPGKLVTTDVAPWNICSLCVDRASD